LLADPAPPKKPAAPALFGTVLEVALDRLDDNPFQARMSMDPEKLDQLARDIAVHGLLEPIVVRRAGERFQVVAGHRRAAAFRLLRDLASSEAERKKYAAVPAQLREIRDDNEMEELGLVENFRREDLTALERAEAVARLRERRGLSSKQIAEKLNESQDAVKALLRLFDAPQALKDGISQGVLVTVLDSSGAPVTTPGGRQKQERRTLDLSAADELGRLYPHWAEGDGEKRAASRLEALIQKVLREGWSVRRVQAHCKDVLAGRTPKAGAERTAAAAFVFDERRLNVDLRRLAGMDAEQKQALRGALNDVMGRL
jgi:ParB/RepB/Spo0J family partition protein